MSDEPARGEAPTATPAGTWEHWCEHPGCSRWGGWGYKIGAQEVRWYCGQHRGAGERLLGRA